MTDIDKSQIKMAAEIVTLKRRVDILMTELTNLKSAHRALKKKVNTPWYKKIWDK
jgi:hypothetical protein